MRYGEVDFGAMNKKAGESLRVAREYVGMSQTELAKQLKISVRELRQYERGEVTIPAVHLYYAEILLNMGGYRFYFYPYTRERLLQHSTGNVIFFPSRFPTLAEIAGNVDPYEPTSC